MLRLSSSSLIRQATQSQSRLVHSSAANQIDIVSGAVILYGSIHAAIKLADLAQAKYDERMGTKTKKDNDDHDHDDHHH